MQDITPRLSCFRKAPTMLEALRALDTALARSGLERSLLHLVRLRTAQPGGCTDCVDLHHHAARADGESAQRLDQVAAWRESPVFTARERAALAWTEAMAPVAPEPVSDTLHAETRTAFAEAELARLTMAVALVDSWNRLAVPFRSVHPVGAEPTAPPVRSEDSTMKLHYMPGACPLAAHIVLEWIGAPYEAQAHNHDDLHGEAYRRINPLGAVPALEVEGGVITQNAGVLDYLAEAFPEARLGGDGTPRGNAEVHRWMGFVNSDVHPAFKPLFGATAYLGDAEVIEKTKAHARKAVHRLLGIANEQLKGRDWIAGSRSIADAYLYVMIRWAGSVGIDISDLTELNRFYAAMNADAGVQRALKAEGLA